MDTIAVELLVGVAGRGFSWHPGQTVDMSEDDAARWCDGERARRIQRPGGPAETTQHPGPPERTDEPVRGDRPAPPPRRGPGSGDKAWRAYAAAAAVDVPADAKREQIWPLLEAGGVATGIP
jgi:hypothetical protein